MNRAFDLFPNKLSYFLSGRTGTRGGHLTLEVPPARLAQPRMTPAQLWERFTIYFTLFLTLWNTHTKTPKHVQGRQKRRRKEKSCTEEWREAVLPPGSSARARRVLLRRGGSRNALPRGQRGHHTVPRDGHESWAPATRVVPVHSQRGQSVRPPALGYPAGSCGPVPAPRTLPAQEGRTQQL